jgi:hypothetical protein
MGKAAPVPARRAEVPAIFMKKSNLGKIQKMQLKAQVIENRDVSQRRIRALIKKMLKMKDDPAIFMKTQGRATECPTENAAFSMQNGPN